MRRYPQFLLGVILIAAVALTGCGAATSPAQAPAADAAVAAAPAAEALNLPVEISAAQLNEIRNRDDVYVLDVREDWEYASGHVPGANLIPLGQLSSRLSEIPADKTVVAVCRSGNRSGQATEILRQAGFDAHNMVGGMNSYAGSGFAVEQ
ncbi:MAG: rhodanese-like domain-containing protein [Caldilineales bacterium]